MTEEFQRSSPLGKDVEPLEVYAEHAEIRKQVHDEIRKLHETFSPDAHTGAIIDRFLSCLTPLKNLHDPSRLPVCTTVPRSTVPDKRSCVWAVVSCLVRAYWEYELENDNGKIEIIAYLNQLRGINLNYPEMKIVGAENKGWWLELEELYGDELSR